jgi:predicted nucleic acid-binding protein
VTASLDANILVYALDDETELRQSAASDLVERAGRSVGFVLTMQSIGELANVLRRKRVPIQTIAMKIDRLRRSFLIVPADPEDLDDALWAVERHKLAFWDAMLWATCRRAGCSILFSEDFQDGRTLKGVRFVNPFLAKNAKYLPKI